MRLGLIGAGFIGRTHLRAAATVPEITVVGFVDPMARPDHPDLAGLRSFPTLAAMAQEGLDGVIVAVPDELHVPVATEGLALGLAVMLEKPAARSLPELLDLAGAAPDIGARLLVAHQRRHHPATRVTKRMIDGGELGRILGVNGVFALRKDDRYFVERPRGVGLVNLIHDIDLLQFFCGRITAVSAIVSHAGRGAAEEDTIAFTAEFENGAVGTMIGTDTVPSPWGWDQATRELPSIPFDEAGTTYSLLGTKASLTVPDLRLYAHRPGEAWHHPLVVSRPDGAGDDAYANQVRHFAAVAGGRATPIVGIAEALNTQAALDAIFVSAREGRRVSTAALIDAAKAGGA